MKRIANLSDKTKQYTDVIRIVNDLIRVIDDGHFLKKEYADKANNPNYFWDLTKQTLRWYPRYINVLNQLLNKPIKKKYRKLEMLLVTSLVRLEHLKDPDYFVVKESVEIVKKMGYNWAQALVNRTLREYLRDQERFRKQYCLDEALKFAHPDWIFNAIKSTWPNHYSEILVANQEKPVRWINVVSKARFDEMLSAYKGRIISYPWSDHSIGVCEHGDFLDFLKNRGDQGYIQDLSAQMLDEVLKHVDSPKCALDACAAPGGKAFVLLGKYPNLFLTCTDIDQGRICILDENMKKFSFGSRVEIVQQDWLAPPKTKTEYDLVVLDAPCSGSGIVKRHPEKKYQPWDLEGLLETQKTLLEHVWPFVRPGGFLVYSTCSILREENNHQIKLFIESKEHAEIVGLNLPIGFGEDYGWQILPSEYHDGHFFSLIQKLS